MSKYKGILFIPFILILYIIVGTVEFRYENMEPVETIVTEDIEVQDYTKEIKIRDYAEEMKAIKSKQAEIRAEIEAINKELEKLKNDEGIPLSYDIRLHLKTKCEKHGVNVREAVAIMLTENPTVNPKLVHRNKDGTSDTGLFQINDCHKKEFRNMGFNDLTDPKQNISYGIYFLSTLDRHEGELKYIAYNCGEGGMKKLASRGITSTEYSRKVMAKLKK